MKSSIHGEHTRVERLPGGLTLVMVPMPHRTSVGVGIWLAVGGRCEPVALNGVSHFIEHMLFKGTRRRSARQISEAIEGVGGTLNAYTSEEHTCYYAKATHDRFREVLDVLTDMILHSRFAPEDVEKERGVIRDEIAMYLDEPQQFVQELLNATLWPEHPLGWPLTGTEASVSCISREALMGFFRRTYNAASTVVAVAGQFRPALVRRAVGAFARQLRPGHRPAYLPARSVQTRPRVRLQTRATEQTQLALGVRTCSRHDRRRYALRVLNTILGENMSSRLFQAVREDSGLAYSIYSTPSFFADTGDLVISAGLESANLERVLGLVVRELSGLVREVPGRQELQRAKDYLLGQIDLGVENTEGLMLSVGEQVLGYGRTWSAAWVKRQLAAVTAGEVRSVAQAFLNPAGLNLALVTPRKRVPGLGKILARMGP